MAYPIIRQTNAPYDGDKCQLYKLAKIKTKLPESPIKFESVIESRSYYLQNENWRLMRQLLTTEAQNDFVLKVGVLRARLLQR
jgi:hypothetical protein